jgi:hypothetical protein
MIKPPRATLRALAYVHVTGWLPKNIHGRTRCNLFEMTDTDDAFGRSWQVKTEYLDLAEAQPLVRAVRHLESLGYKRAPHVTSRSTKGGISFERPSQRWRDRVATAYPSGRWSIGYGRESGSA